MAKRYGRKRGLERKEKPKRFGAQKRAKKNSDIEEELAHGSTSGSLGDPSDNHSGSMTSEEHDEEEVVYKEPSMYDNLLRTIGSGSESLANVYKKIEGGKSESEEEEEDDDDEDEMEDDSENDVDGGSASPRVSREVNVGKKGKFDNTGVSGAVKSKLADDILLGDVEQNEDAESDVETSDTDQEHDFTVDGPNAIDASKSTSSFNIHLEHKLTDEEIENLGKGKWKYGWEVPAFSMPACKWIGTGECFLKDMNWDYGLKLKLYKHWLDIYEKSGGKDFHLSKQSLFFYLCNSYRDILHCNKKPFFAKGAEEDSSVMDAYIIHSLNHVFRSRNLVTKNDVKLGKHSEIAKGEILAAGGFLDHGFTRPKVLILLPLASIAFRVVKRLIQLTPSSQKVNVEHIDRFCNNFGAEDEDNNDQDSKPQKSRKPSDFDLLFGGNNTDSFMIGIKFIRKGIKLYSDFYSSDIIVASPAGLIAKIVDAQQVKEKDVDYLSSIEVLVIDHADVIAMQNWSLVDTVVQQLNHIPDNQHGTNVMRIRPWYLDGQAKFYRQTIILGSYLNPDINALFNHRCFNFQGKVKSACEYKGVLPRVLLQVRQIYERFDTDSIANADDARLEYFSKKVFPKIKDSLQGGIMLFVSSYFEFVRVRNFLKSQSASFCLLGDYTAQSDISRSRVWFFEGSRKIMLYTERAHFYHRYKIRGIKNLIIYSCPERKEFYPEIVNMLEGSHDISCTVLFSCFDQLRLERIVGNAAAKRMLKSKNNIFVFHQETDS